MPKIHFNGMMGCILGSIPNMPRARRDLINLQINYKQYVSLSIIPCILNGVIATVTWEVGEPKSYGRIPFATPNIF